MKQYPQRWKQYQEASPEDKKTFFEENEPIKETLHHYFGGKQITQQYLINAPIVNVIIGEMIWDPEDIDSSTHTNMMSSFKHYINESNYVEEGEGADQFCIQINNHVHFSLAIQYLQAGLMLSTCCHFAGNYAKAKTLIMN